MDGINVLINALRGTLNPDQKAIKEAEAFLNSLGEQAGYATALMQVMMMQAGNPANTSGMTLELPVRQAAAIAFKNLIRRRWGLGAADDDDSSKAALLSEADKATVRANLFDVMCLAEPLIKKQLAVTVRWIAMADYPGVWPDMLTKLLSYTKTGRFDAVYSSLLALSAVFASFGFVERDSDEGKICDAAIRESFPTLAEIVKAAAGAGAVTSEVLRIEALALKVLHHATLASVPRALSNNDVTTNPMSLLFWAEYAKSVLLRPLVTSPQSSAGCDSELWWKGPRRASEFIERMLVRYGARKDVSNKAVRKATEGLRTKFFPGLVKPVEELLARAEATEMPERVLYMLFAYLANSVMYKHPYAVLKGDLMQVIQQLAFPRLCATAEDLRDAAEEPVEYLRREFDCTNVYSSARQGANELIVNACKFRPEFLMPVMVFLSQTLQAATQASNASLKYGALTLVASLEGCIKRTKALSSEIEPMLTRYVVPELFAQHAAVRAVAAFTLGRYCDIAWASADTFTQALRRIVEMAGATEEALLAPAVYSAMALKYFVQTDAGRELMRPGLGTIFAIFYRFIDRVDLDLDDLVIALEVFVEAYGEAVAPYARGICDHLLAAFSSVVSALATAGSNSDMGDVDGYILKAIGCLETLGTILISIHSVPDLFRSIGATLMGIFAKIFEAVGTEAGEVFMDYIEEVLSLTQLVTFWTRPTPAEYWIIFPLICKVFSTCGAEYMADLLPPLDNFISFGTDAFLANPAYMEMVYSICTAAIGDENAEEIEALKACQLAESVFHHCRGRADVFVSKILELVVARLRTARTRPFKVFLIELVANGLYYNTELTFRILEAANATQLVFTTWGTIKSAFSRTYDKKISIIGLSSIFRIQGAVLPHIVQAAIPQIIGLILYFLTEVEKQYRSKIKQQQQQQNTTNYRRFTLTHTHTYTHIHIYFFCRTRKGKGKGKGSCKEGQRWLRRGPR